MGEIRLYDYASKDKELTYIEGIGSSIIKDTDSSLEAISTVSGLSTHAQEQTNKVRPIKERLFISKITSIDLSPGFLWFCSQFYSNPFGGLSKIYFGQVCPLLYRLIKEMKKTDGSAIKINSLTIRLFFIGLILPVCSH